MPLVTVLRSKNHRRPEMTAGHQHASRAEGAISGGPVNDRRAAYLPSRSGPDRMIEMRPPRPFIDGVCRTFGLGEPMAVDRLPGGANVLWRFRTDSGSYVVKELPAEDFEAASGAAEFESAVFKTGRIDMAEPCADENGHYVRNIIGSRGLPVSARAHRWVAGQPISEPGSLARHAGSTLAVIQSLGEHVPCGPNTHLWHEPDYALLARLDLPRAQEVLAEAQALVELGLAAARPQFAHCDFKPVNCLLERGRLIVLDWDEAAAYDARLEAVESALRWSDDVVAGPDPAIFAAFAEGYQPGFPPLRRQDWAKCISALASWFEFMAASSLGAWPEIALEPRAAAAAAHDAMSRLTETLQKIPQWTVAINAALRSS